MKCLASEAPAPEGEASEHEIVRRTADLRFEKARGRSDRRRIISSTESAQGRPGVSERTKELWKISCKTEKRGRRNWQMNTAKPDQCNAIASLHREAATIARDFRQKLLDIFGFTPSRSAETDPPRMTASTAP